MKEATNGIGTARWIRLKQLLLSLGLHKRKAGGATRSAAYSDYWQVRNHRAAAPNRK